MKTQEQSFQQTHDIYTVLTTAERARFLREIALHLGKEYVVGFLQWIRSRV